MNTPYRRHLGKRFSEGARLLWAVVARERLSVRAVRAKIGSGGDVTRWLYGDSLPPFAAIMAIARIWKIGAETWLQPPKRPFTVPALRKAAA